jgi:hypothetical protein
MVGEYVLVETETNRVTEQKKQFKKYIDALQNNIKNSSNAESLLKELKNVPFICISDRTTYNKSGRIKSMYFEQAVM